MNDLQIFNNEEFGTVRTIQIDGQPYFLAKDIAVALKYVNPRDAVMRHCKGVVKHDTPTNSGLQSMSYIPEGDMYRLIVRSKLPEAERFEKWVFETVIPSIRKTGNYGMRDVSDLSPQLQLFYGMVDQLAKNERQIRETREIAEKAADSLEVIKDAIQPVIDGWRKATNEKVKKITKLSDKPFKEMWDEMYHELELRAGCNLSKRLENLRSRMIYLGETKTSVDKLCKLDVIERDKKLREIFSKIVTEYAVRYCS